MVDAYQGEVDVRSEKGKGTTFTIHLPAAQSGSR
jgi:signal transduction histidine kinase